MDTESVVEEYFDVPSGKLVDRRGNECSCNKLKCQCKYRAGGHNYGTGVIDKRGYYMSVCPVNVREIGDGLVSESYVGFSGFYDLLVECGRRGKKAAEEAEKEYRLRLAESVSLYYPGNDVDFGYDFRKPIWTFQKNDSGAYILFDGVEVAHVPNIFSSEAANHGIPLGGTARAKWLCGMLEKVNAVS